MTAVLVFVFMCGLLFIGKIIRVNVPLLQRLYLPSSVVGGIVGLLVFVFLGRYMPAEVHSCMSRMPGFLINIVFATMFLGIKVPKFKSVIGVAFPHLCLGQIMAWGQYVVGLSLSGFFLSRCYGLPAAFGNLIEIGFEGGHGTVGGMIESFRAFGWEEGIAMGFTVATAGMVIGIVAGMAMIQWAHKNGYVKSILSFSQRETWEKTGLYLMENRPSAGKQTVVCDSIDSLAWHIVIIGVTIGIGYLIYSFIPMKGFPLFPFCMIVGILLEFISKKIKKSLYIDRVQMERISGASLDFLVVSAVATIRLEVVTSNWQPLLILITAGAAWSIFVVMFLGHRIMHDAWFERSIAEFGQATGVTATGLMLLRTVDPENKTLASMAFGYKQLLHEPFLGGGLWTALAFTLVFTTGWQKVLAISAGMLVFWLICGWFISKNKKLFR